MKTTLKLEAYTVGLSPIITMEAIPRIKITGMLIKSCIVSQIDTIRDMHVNNINNENTYGKKNFISATFPKSKNSK